MEGSIPSSAWPPRLVVGAACGALEFAAETTGYTATRHQREVGTGYCDQVAEVISAGSASTLALEGSTEQAQF